MLDLPDPAEIEALIAVATEDEKAALTELLALRLSLESPLAFAQRVSPGTQPFPHTLLLDQYLVAVVDHALYHRDSAANKLRPDLPEGISDKAVWEWDLTLEDGSGRFVHPVTGEECVYNLAISMPPQHGKSYMVSHHLPAWYLIRYPDRNAAVVSYEHDFAASWTSKVRRLIEEHPEYGVFLDPSTRAKDEWNLKGHGGGILAAGVGGPLTGRPLYLTVMDDLIKNNTEAMSETALKTAREWWATTAKTRNQSPRWVTGWDAANACPLAEPEGEPSAGVRILMHTRWSPQDLIGYVQIAEGDEWFYLNLPAISEGTDPDALPEGHYPDPLGRPKGRALAPMLHSLAVLERIKKSGDPEDPESGGAFWFEANYQGYPTVEGQGIFPRPFNYFERRSDKLIFSDGYVCYDHQFRHYCTVDLAASTKTRADFTVFMHFGQAPDGRLVVLDIFRDRLESPDHEDKLIAWLDDKPRMMFVGIENKTFGTVLIQHLLRRGKLPVRPLEADTDKVTRAIPAGQACKNHRVWWDRDVEWRPRFEAELDAFPMPGVKDDMVDTLAYGVQVWEQLPGSFRPAGEPQDGSREAAVKRHKDRILKKRARQRARHPEIGRL